MPLLGVIFDFDGVIANTEPLHLKAYQDVLVGGPLSLGTDIYYSRYLGYDDVGVFSALGKDQGIELQQGELKRLVEIKGQRFAELLGADEVLFSGAKQCIERLAAEVPLAIASGALHHEIDSILARTNLRRHFMDIVAADDVSRPKPAPDAFVRAVELLNAGLGRTAPPSCFVAIEDSQWGIRAAHAAGVPCVAVTHTYPAEALHAAERVVSTLSQVKRHLLDELC